MDSTQIDELKVGNRTVGNFTKLLHLYPTFQGLSLQMKVVYMTN
uniref:Uncharacterized protein n=1 Tax=Rhizophora mucronata TaxID=61149 RepID=A0A2P2P5N9_RHIMU